MGGEIPALAITDSLIRAIPEAIDPQSYQQETFTNSQLDFATYTRPELFEDLKVPSVLLSGNHKKIEEWRKKNSQEKIQYSVAQGGFIQVTYQVFNPATREEKTVVGNVIGKEIDSIGIGSLNFYDKIDFEEGEYIKKLSAIRDMINGYIGQVRITVASTMTNKTRSFWFMKATTPVTIAISNITLKNVACLAGYGGGPVAGEVEIANPQDQIKILTAELGKVEQVLNKYGIHDIKELDEAPEEIKKQVNLLALLQPQMATLTQKYSDSQTELNSTKNELSAKNAENHLLNLQVTNLTSEIVQKDNRITDLEKRPNVSSNDWTNDFSKRPTQKELDDIKNERDNRPDTSLIDQTPQQVKGQLVNLGKGPSQQDFDDLRQQFLDYKKDKIGERIENMIENFQNELGGANLERDLRLFFGNRYHSLLTKHLTLDKLNDDNYFKQVESTIKIVVYSAASLEAERKQKPLMQYNTTDHDTKKEMIVLFDKLYSFDTSQLLPIEIDVAKNPFYSDRVGKIIGNLTPTSTPIIIKKRELEELLSDYEEKLEKNDFEDLKNFLEASEEVIKTDNKYAKGQKHQRKVIGKELAQEVIDEQIDKGEIKVPND
ncbi:6287_t:CDS:2 [Funneliformis geosporum]|uniref:tRNA (guanine-N(1)-)-methyltransferase n=1 Tax=Funneliformis geosporum TaxID=1117311 RepID=A0A9W4WTK3_9GLOM|nr:6287_t:CDS:2 [Funneliformis geosporum]